MSSTSRSRRSNGTFMFRLGACQYAGENDQHQRKTCYQVLVRKHTTSITGIFWVRSALGLGNALLTFRLGSAPGQCSPASPQGVLRFLPPQWELLFGEAIAVMLLPLGTKSQAWRGVVSYHIRNVPVLSTIEMSPGCVSRCH